MIIAKDDDDQMNASRVVNAIAISMSRKVGCFVISVPAFSVARYDR
jgi:hypothetical protein